jgi:uncharacterized OsmC-like protein
MSPDPQLSAPTLMRTKVHVRVTDSPDKLVTLPTATAPVPMGMHGELAAFYGAADGSFIPHASTLDYVAGAVTACLAGTFKRALGARGIAVTADTLEVIGTGDIVVDNDVPVLRRVEVAYTLNGTEPADREKIERAHAVHDRGCAVSRSLSAAIDITTTLTLT